MMRTFARSLIAVVALALGLALPTLVRASAPPEAQAVLAQEARWVNALANRDAKALGAILGENFVHINYQGKVRYREDELARVAATKTYSQHTSEQTVDFFGNTAIVHGLNSITRGGKVVLRLRYTDVYAKQHGQWIAVSAQETAIAR
jgi:ketosteroid isomerase-like protein